MSECKYLQKCEFVLRYVEQVKPHWDDFVSLYCHGEFQDVCKRFEQFNLKGVKPDPRLMPTGQKVPCIINKK